MLRERFSRNPDNVLLLAGGLSTELELRGYSINGNALWSSKLLYEAPEAIYQVHRDYLSAGADIITTCSYQGFVEGFMRNGFNQLESEELLRSSVVLAKKARQDHMMMLRDSEELHETIKEPTSLPLVALSLGSYGATLANGAEYRGDFNQTIEQLMEFHANRLDCLLLTKPDILLFETIPCKKEAQAICRLLKEKQFHIDTILSFSCRDNQHVCHGESFSRDCVPLVNEISDIVGVGVNCTSPYDIEDLIRSAKSMTTKRLVSYPNTCESSNSSQNEIGVTTKEYSGDLSDMALRYRDAGASIIGGCCETHPSDITAMRSRLLR